MTFANAFSDSSYSNECSMAMPRSKSFCMDALQALAKLTVPNSLLGGPQAISSPRLSSISVSLAIAWGELFSFCLHANNTAANRRKLGYDILFILPGFLVYKWGGGRGWRKANKVPGV